MSLLSGIGNFLGGLFGGGDSEEEKRRKQQQAQQQQANITLPNGQSPLAPRPEQNQNAPFRQPDSGINLVLPETLKKAVTNDPGDEIRRKLAQKEADAMPDAQKQAEQGENWFDRNFFQKGANADAAKVIARNRAISQYQNENGYNKDPIVLDYGKKTSDIAAENSRKSSAKLDQINKISDITDKVGEAAQWVPITGSLMNLGNLGVEKLQKAAGDTAGAQATKNTRNRVEFGMNQDQWDSLGDEQRGKYNLIRNAGYALTPLDFTGLGGLAKAEGAAVAKKAALQLAKEGAVDEATKVALKEVAKTELKKAAVSTAVGTGINLGAQQYLTGQVDPLEALKGGAMVGGTSLLVPEAPKKAGIKALDSAKVASDARTVATSVDAPEVAPGVKSANPNREVDALSASVQQAAKEADDARARAEAEAKNAPRAATPGEIDTPAVRNAVDGVSAPEGVVNTLEQTRTAANDGIQVPPDVQQARQAIANDLARTPDSAAEVGTALARSEGGISPEVAQAEPVVQPRAASPDLESPLAAQAAQAEYDAATGAVPVQPPVDGISPAVADAVPTPANAVDAPAIPQIPESALGNLEQAPAAPRTHDALVRQMGEEGKAYKGKYTDRDVLQLEDLKNSAHAAIANVPDDELLRSFATADPETMVTNPQSFAIARASLDRLYKMADDPLAQQQVSNILDAMSKFESRSGQNLRVVQEEFDNMPLPMKVRYIVKKIDAANAETKNYAALADDPAKATVVEANITGHLQASQNIAERVAALEGQLNNAADAIKNGEAPGVNVKDIAKQLKKERISLEANNGELVKYYSDLVPGSSKGKKVNDFARRMMLASFTGRVNDVLTTTANVANEAGNNVTQGLLAKAINFVKPGTVTEGWRGGSKLVKGVVSGAGKTAGEIGGTQYTDNLEGALRNNTEMRSQLQKTQGKVGRTIQAATEAATNLSEGVKDQKLYQLAVQEGQKAGLKGSDLKGYAEARAAVPTRQMLDAAETLHKEINNLNENPVTRTLNRVASGIEGKSAAGGFLKNQVLPFTSWLGGNIYNSVTDKNVIASTYKFGRDALRGDTEGAVRNLAKTINGAAQAYALGYAMTQAGLITNQDAEGYNDGGAYFHIGDRYIPVGMLGFFAPNIILGNATYNGLNNNDGKNPAVAIAENIATNGVKALQLGNALGVESNLARSYDEATKPGGSVADGALQFAAGGVGQFIPGAAGDLNAVLNNFTGLNPTKEKADTKVVKDELTKEGKPSTARDSMRSTIAGLVNRIPFASQTLPRKAGVAADDPIDRITKGDRDTQIGKDARATAKAKVDREKDFKARGIPNPEKDGFEKAVDARFENKEYDSAIEGLQAKLDKQKSNKDIPKSDLKDTEDKIKLMQLHKDGGYDPSVVDLYKKTSLAEWRAMGDPESDEYNLSKYQKLWEYDSARAKAGISKDTDTPDQNAFSAKKPAKKRGGGGSSELSRIKSNTIGSAPTLGKVDFSGFKPQKAGSIKMPKLTQVKSGELIKKRAISVRKG